MIRGGGTQDSNERAHRIARHRAYDAGEVIAATSAMGELAPAPHSVWTHLQCALCGTEGLGYKRAILQLWKTCLIKGIAVGYAHHEGSTRMGLVM